MREVDLHTERWAVFEAILAGAGIDDSIRLNRRHRWKPLAAHVDDEDAVILWAYRQRKEGTELRVDQFSRLAGRSITLASTSVPIVFSQRIQLCSSWNLK